MPALMITSHTRDFVIASTDIVDVTVLTAALCLKQRGGKHTTKSQIYFELKIECMHVIYFDISKSQSKPSSR